MMHISWRKSRYENSCLRFLVPAATARTTSSICSQSPWFTRLTVRSESFLQAVFELGCLSERLDNCGMSSGKFPSVIYCLFKLVTPAAVSVRKGIGSIRVNLPRKDGPTRGGLPHPTPERSNVPPKTHSD